MPEKGHSYIAMDLKSFYASVECVDRGLEPLTTNLVVADASRTEKTICLAVSPSLKAYGISGRARLFEVEQRIREVNASRKSGLLGDIFTGKSYDAIKLEASPSLAAEYIIAPPRMARYMEYSAKIYGVYLNYVAPEDLYAYSIDEVFMDVSGYLGTYGITARELAGRIIQDILQTTGITAVAGIGTNLYLCKVAMDIGGKHAIPDENGVRIAELNEMSDMLALDLVDKGLVAGQVALTVGYDTENLKKIDGRFRFKGELEMDCYGRKMPKGVHGTENLPAWTSSSRLISNAIMKLYNHIVNPDLLVRRISIAASHIMNEEEKVAISSWEQMELFTDYEALERAREKEEAVLGRERKLQEAVLEIKKRYGKNAILKGMSLQEGATAMERNRQIGGHKA